MVCLVCATTRVNTGPMIARRDAPVRGVLERLDGSDGG